MKVSSNQNILCLSLARGNQSASILKQSEYIVPLIGTSREPDPPVESSGNQNILCLSLAQQDVVKMV